MKFFFSKKEYRILLDMLFVAEWIMGARDVDFEKNNPQYHELSQKILASFHDMQVDDIIIYEELLDGYFQTADYEEQLHKRFIAPYEEDVFWEELADRLARRDLIKKYGLEKLNNLEPVERMVQLTELSAKYEELFATEGLDSINMKMLKN